MTSRIRRIGHQLLSSLIVPATLILPTVAAACPVCFGEPDSATTRGLKAAIALLSGAATLVLGGIGAVVVGIARRAKQGRP